MKPAMTNGNGKTSGNGTKQAPRVRRVGVYLRVSKALKHKGKTDKDYTSIDSQRDTCLSFIRTQPGWTFAAEYVDDGRSGKNLNRPSVRRMFADIDSGAIDAIVVYKVDRLSRSIRDFSDIMRVFERHDVAFASVTQTFSTDTAMGKLIVNILMSFAEFEREMTAERTADKIAAAVREGRWPGGPSPLGYDYADSMLHVNEAEAAIVREAFASYLKLRSAFDVAAKLNADKRPPKVRGDKDKSTARAWTKDAVIRVLRNPVYIGKLAHDGETFDGVHSAIVPADTFEAARAILDAQAIDGKRTGRNAAYVLQSVLRCGCVLQSGEACGHAMSPGSGGKGNGRYRYYRCVGKEKGANACEARPLPADAIEAFVVDRLREIASAGQVTAELTRFADRLESIERPGLVTRAAEYAPRIAQVSASGSELADRMVQANAGARSFMERQLETLGAELETLQSELAALQARIATIDAVVSEARWIVDQLATVGATWDHASHETRGHIVRAMVRSVHVNEAANEIAIVFSPLESGRRALDVDADAGVSVVKGALYRVRGRAVAFTPDAPPAELAPVRRPARIASLLALAHHMDQAIRDGKYADRAQLARALGLTRARITQVANLTCLAPDIQAEILALEAVDGREPIRERALRPVCAPLMWDRQREIWAQVKASAPLVNQQSGASDQNRADRDSRPAPEPQAPAGSESLPRKREPGRPAKRAQNSAQAAPVVSNKRSAKAAPVADPSANPRGTKRPRG